MLKKHSLCLLLTAASSLATIVCPLYVGNRIASPSTTLIINAKASLPLEFLEIIIALIALVTIGMNRDHRKQLLLTSILFCLGFLQLLLLFQLSKQFVTGSFALGSLLCLMILILLGAAVYYEFKEIAKTRNSNKKITP